MARPIDEIDHAIISCLQIDGRTPSAAIARHVGIAERTVRARIDRLVRDEVIRLVAIINPHALGYTVIADVFLEVELGKVQEVAETVSGFAEVMYVGLTTGDSDISLQLFAPSVDALYDFVTEKLNHIPGVLRARTFVIPRIVKSIDTWSLPEKVPASISSHDAEPQTRRRS